MSTKKKPAPIPEPAKEDPKALKIPQLPTEGRSDSLAHASLLPTVQAALTLRDYNQQFGDLAINTLVDDLGKQCERASGGDLKRAETILTAQAHTLDAIFHVLARKAKHVEYLNQLDTHLRLALKAQAQCRATLETLVAIKNPQPVAFVRQANIAHGPQQVNNDTGPGISAPVRAPARAGDFDNPPDKLLEKTHGERLDPGTAGATGRVGSPLETVGAVNRTEDGSR